MKKIFRLLAIASIFALVSCEMNENDPVKSVGDGFVLRGNVASPTKTSFGTPGTETIPFLWDEGDVIYVNGVESNPLAEGGATAEFTFTSGSVAEGDDVFYGYYNVEEDGKVWILPDQTGDSNSIDGDFGYAVVGDDNSFTLDHYSSYLWLNSYSDEVTEKVKKIVIVATHDIAGSAEFDKQSKTFGFISPIFYDDPILVNTKSIVIDYEHRELKSLLNDSSDDNIWVTAVTFPVETGKFRIDYYFENGSVASYSYPSATLQPGHTYKITQEIKSEDLKAYDLKFLTFEDEDFDEGICLPYEINVWEMNWGSFQLEWTDTREIRAWSDFITGDTYGNGHNSYSWIDNGNTNLQYLCSPDRGVEDNGFWGIAGHSGISCYTTNDYENYGNFMYDLLAYNVTGGANGSVNFCTHYGYKDPDEYNTGYGPTGDLPGISFSDGEARVIDHMYVTHTAYGYNVLVSGETDFGGNYVLDDRAMFKIVAYGYESDEDADPTVAEFYLLAPGQIFAEGWCKWDLSVLGKVVKVEFNLIAGSTGYGKYGNVLPAYFAYDDVAVRFNK